MIQTCTIVGIDFAGAERELCAGSIQDGQFYWPEPSPLDGSHTGQDARKLARYLSSGEDTGAKAFGPREGGHIVLRVGGRDVATFSGGKEE